MSFEDFTMYFKNVDRCYIGPDVIARANEFSGKIYPCHFDYVHVNDEWNSLKNTNGDGFPKGIKRGRHR